ncbi:histidine kinase N-terminal 7TM domain-containing protein [Haloarcula litorea]|uniref:sensor histidine kinase n=1 Tax=Haloarcula litorea TaxID=3032579 RepID=UPI0023E8F51B|nr:histidine kinase N-terminal 7TM domain-containing protein [Halomicroarcula sp. GDY20]
MGLTTATLVAIASGFAGLVSLAIAAAAWHNRSVPGAGPLGWLLVAASGWCLLEAAWVVTTDPATARAVFVSMRLTSGSMVALWVVFALVFTGRRAWLTPARLAGLLVVSNGYTLLAATDAAHGLVDLGVVRATASGMTMFVPVTGPYYVGQTVLSYALVGVGYVLLGEFLLRSRNLYRKQTFLVLVSGVLTATAHALFTLGVSPHPGLNVAPLTFAANGVLIGVSLFRYDFLAVTPLARDILVDELPDPMLVLAPDGTVIDYNTAAADLVAERTGEPADALDHEPLAEVAPDLLADVEAGEVLTVGSTLTHYEPQTRTITDQHGTERGRLVILRDVTGQRRRQDRLEALQAATQQFLGAESAERIGRLTVDFATRVLDQHVAGVFLADGDELDPVAVSDAAREQFDASTLRSTAGEENSLWTVYRSGRRRIVSLDDVDAGPWETVLVLPLGDHGVLAVGSETDTYTPEDEQYAEVLARTTEVALEQVTRERQLQESRASVQRQNEQIEFFNGVLRHSLRNAMLVIRGRAAHLREHVPEGEAHHVDSIEDWCGKLTDMSESIRAINQTAAASESRRLDAVDLGATLHRVAGTVDRQYRDASVTLHVDAAPVLGDNLTEEVLLSVAENAVVHNDGEPHVEIVAERIADRVQVRIADDGPGISDDLKETVFERSLTADQTADGFGLYFVSVMMELYGGTVWLEDNDPTGTVAVLEFKLADDDPSRDVPGDAPDAVDGSGTDAGDGVPDGRTDEAQGNSPDD